MMIEEFLSDFMQGTLELNDFDVIDEYGVECSFKPQYEYSQLDIYEYKDGSGFTLEYQRTSNGDLVDMKIRLKFMEFNDNLQCIFSNIDLQ